MGNLILSCHDCNHNKNSFWIEKEEMDTLNPDGEKIKNVFIRDDKYYIRINEVFQPIFCESFMYPAFSRPGLFFFS